MPSENKICFNCNKQNDFTNERFYVLTTDEQWLCSQCVADKIQQLLSQ